MRRELPVGGAGTDRLTLNHLTSHVCFDGKPRGLEAWQRVTQGEIVEGIREG